MIDPSKRQDPPRPAGDQDHPLSAIPSKHLKIDLPPDDWQSDRKRRREPIFGSGFPSLLVQLTISAVTLGLLVLLLLLAVAVKKKAQSLIYGEPQGSHQLKPGESKVIDGYTIKRID